MLKGAVLLTELDSVVFISHDICSGLQSVSPLSGLSPQYLLLCLTHGTEQMYGE